MTHRGRRERRSPESQGYLLNSYKNKGKETANQEVKICDRRGHSMGLYSEIIKAQPQSLLRSP